MIRNNQDINSVEIGTILWHGCRERASEILKTYIAWKSRDKAPVA
jgi:hypothetical protein